MCRVATRAGSRAWAGILIGVGFAVAMAGANAASAPKKSAAPESKAPATEAAPARAGKGSLSERLRPSGPVTVTAKNVDWAKGGMMVYTGDVKLSSDTLNLDGDRLELEQLGGGEYRAKVTGGPAHLQHDGDPAAKDQPEPPVNARAKTLIYDSKSGLVDVTGDALVTRGEDQITGESIHYNVIERRIQAAGGNNGQVRMVIQPPPKDKNAEGTKPVAAASQKAP